MKKNNGKSSQRKLRNLVSVLAYGHEIENDSLVEDGVYDKMAKKVDLTVKTGNKKLDDFFATEYLPNSENNSTSGMWIHNHPYLPEIKRLYEIMKQKKLPDFDSDEAAEKFLETADMSAYLTPDNLFPKNFEFLPKDKKISMRFADPFLNQIKEAAKNRGVSYQKYIRMAVEQSLQQDLRKAGA